MPRALSAEDGAVVRSLGQEVKSSNEPGFTQSDQKESTLKMNRQILNRRFRLNHLMGAGVSLGEALAGQRILGQEDRTVLGVVSFCCYCFGGLI